MLKLEFPSTLLTNKKVNLKKKRIHNFEVTFLNRMKYGEMDENFKSYINLEDVVLVSHRTALT